MAVRSDLDVGVYRIEMKSIIKLYSQDCSNRNLFFISASNISTILPRWYRLYQIVSYFPSKFSVKVDVYRILHSDALQKITQPIYVFEPMLPLLSLQMPHRETEMHESQRQEVVDEW